MKYASETLLEGSPCILCPTKQSDPNALKKVKKFWESLKMKTVSMNPSLHDSTVAQISHLPHVVASLLSASLSGTPKDSFAFAGGGLKDTTRVAGGSPILWQTIIEQNSKEILQSLEKFEEVVLTHTCRELLELDYGKSLAKNMLADPLLSEIIGSKFSLISTTTRENSEFTGRMTNWLLDSRFKNFTGESLNVENDRVMICGSMDMLKSHKGICENIDMIEGSNSDPGHFVIEKAFTD